MKIKDPIVFGMGMMLFITHAVALQHVMYMFRIGIQDDITTFAAVVCATGAIFAMHYSIRKE